MAEIAIHRDQRANLGRAGLENAFVWSAGKPLLADGHDVMAGCPQQFNSAMADVLVDLEPHTPVPPERESRDRAPPRPHRQLPPECLHGSMRDIRRTIALQTGR